MYYYLYKKQINILLLVLIIIVVSFSSYYFIWNPMENVQFSIKWNSITFDDSKISKKNYDYYQIYVYPNEYTLDCTSKMDWLCDKIQKNKLALKKFNLWFYWHNIDDWNVWDIKLETIFNWEKKWVIKDIFNQLYVWDNNYTKLDKSDEKYFQYKNNLNSTDIYINTNELICFKNIKNSTLDWILDRDNVIKTRVENECKTLWGDITDITWNHWMGNLNSVNLKLSIKSLKLEYIFYSEKNKKYNEKLRDTKIINSSINYEWIYEF